MHLTNQSVSILYCVIYSTCYSLLIKKKYTANVAKNVFSSSISIIFYLKQKQSLLTHVSRSTKHTLNRLGVFTVSSFHAYICARSPSLLNNLLAGRGATRRRAVAPILSRSNSLSSRKSQSVAPSQSSAAGHEGEKQFRVNLPDGQVRIPFSSFIFFHILF